MEIQYDTSEVTEVRGGHSDEGKLWQILPHNDSYPDKQCPALICIPVGARRCLALTMM